MFDIGGYELILIAAVAILVVGPRELPGMLRSVGRFVTQGRQMMTGVQRQFNDALKEAELDDLKKTIDDVRSLNPATKIRQTIAKEFKPLTDAGDSVKKAVGEVKIKGPAPAAATAAATPAIASAQAAEKVPAAAVPAKAAPAKSTTAAAKKPAAKKSAVKKTAAKKTSPAKAAEKKSAAKASAASSPGSTLTQSKPRKAATAPASQAPVSETPANGAPTSNTSASDGG